LLAEWFGLGQRREMDAREFLAEFNLASLPASRVVFTDRDDAWLLGKW
jgi:hypothetical protein